jgi:hypothetical protein
VSLAGTLPRGDIARVVVATSLVRRVPRLVRAVSATPGASPLVTDCQTIIRNIEGDGSTDFDHEVVGHPHREILSDGTCAFGIEATKTDGNVQFTVGGQS